MIIADTGFFIALLNRDDSLHQRAVDLAKGLNEPLITTWPVLTETCHLLLARGGSFLASRFLVQNQSAGTEVYNIPKHLYPRLPKLMAKHRDLPMDLADASLVLLAEHLGHGRILSTDRRDFGAYRWKERKPFENLLVD